MREEQHTNAEKKSLFPSDALVLIKEKASNHKTVYIPKILINLFENSTLKRKN